MGLKLVDLLRWSKEVTLLKPNGDPIERDGKPVTVWLRIIGDQDLENSYKSARAASARTRVMLRNKDSEEYLATLSIIEDARADECKEIIVSSQRRDYNSLAYANVERPDMPKIEELAVDADAPTLEEQEKYDKVVEGVNSDYLKALNDYVTDQETKLRAELDIMSIEELRLMTINALIDIQSLEVFIRELSFQKVFRSVYADRLFKESAFESIDEFKQFKLKDQLITEYELLEIAPDDVKN